MNRVDRLIIKAKKLNKASGEELTVAIIEPVASGYKIYMTLWNGKQGQARQIIKKATSQKKAKEIIEATANEYPNKKDVVVIFDDLVA